MGSCLALYLSRKGHRVSLFESALRAMNGPSRWNEGKIHLGFLYSNDGGGGTVSKLMPGGIQFQPLLEDLLATDITPLVTIPDDLYLVHTHSVVSPDDTASYFSKVICAALQAPDWRSYFGGVLGRGVRRLSRSEMEGLGASPQSIMAGFATPERSVDTQGVADLIEAALAGAEGLTFEFGRTVTSVEMHGSRDQWSVACADGREGPFDHVVNALWNGLPEIDEALGLAGGEDYSHRLRLSVFGQTPPGFEPLCAVVCTGPFGDIKTYPDGKFYLSWYPDGLVAEGVGAAPPAVILPGREEKAAMADRKVAAMGALLSPVNQLAGVQGAARVEGGWVLALGSGSLADPKASIHRRERFGVAQRGGYISVNTGKYSMAPLLAKSIADTL